MTDENDIQDDDRALFRQAMKDVKQLKVDKVASEPKSKPKVRYKRQVLDDDAQTSPSIFISDPTELPIKGDAFVSFKGGSFSPRNFKRFKQGKASLDAKLDLHGYTVMEAKDVFLRFIQEAKQEQYKSLLIIHGKGQRQPGKEAILKNHVIYWLEQFDNLLAYCSSLPRDGGTGATYVYFSSF